MRRVTWLFVVLFFLCFSLSAVQAADTSDNEKWKYKGEVFGAVGYGRFSHGNNSYGKGLQVEGGVGVRPFSGALDGLGFEFKIVHQNFKRETSPDHSTEGHFNAFIGSAHYHFGDSKVQPYLGGGIGVLKADYTQRILSDWYDEEMNHYIENRVYTVNESKMVIRVAGGLKIALTQNFSLRPEFQILDTTAGEGYNWSNIGFTLAAGVHF